jgi:uncharacterized protein (TIGR03437 family)
LTGTPESLFTTGGVAPITVPPGGTRRIDVLAFWAALAVGAYRGALMVHVAGDGRVRLVDLLAVVGQGIPAAARKQGERQAAGCVPTRLVPVSTLQTVAFIAPTGLPLPMEVKVLDDCGDPMTSGGVVASFSGSPTTVPLVHLADGRWAGTLQAQGNAGAVTALIQADDPVRNLQGSLAISGELQATQGIPSVNEGGVVSAAASAVGLGAPLAPGGIYSAFGINLADGSNAATAFPVPTVLSNSRVALGGRESPLFFAGPTQINGMFPYDLTPNTSYQLSVRRGNRRSNYVEVVLAGTQPSVFTLALSGSGQGSIVDGARQTVLADASNPVPRGGSVVIYLEGLGAVNRAVTPGEPAPGSPLAEAVAPVSVTIGGLPAQVLFAGLTPGFTGLYQVNAAVPAGVTPGSAVPVVVTAGGLTSPPVTIAVQ